MTANCIQASISQQLAASTTSRRRSLPPSPPEPVSQSLNQRWRETTPLSCPACDPQAVETESFTPSLVVPHVTVRAHMSCRTNAPPARTSVGRDSPEQCGPRSEQKSVRARRMFSRGGTSHLQIQIQTSHHRAFHAGAVLGIVDALRCASTRPTAGPSGIDDASARHMSGSYAMVGRVSITRTVLTKESCGRMLALSRQCRTALPPFASRATERASGRRPQGTTSSAILPHRSPLRDHRGRLVGTPMSCEPRDLSRRIILRITRRAEGRSPAALHCPGLNERKRRSNHSRSSPLGA